MARQGTAIDSSIMLSQRCIPVNFKIT